MTRTGALRAYFLPAFGAATTVPLVEGAAAIVFVTGFLGFFASRLPRFCSVAMTCLLPVVGAGSWHRSGNRPPECFATPARSDTGPVPTLRAGCCRASSRAAPSPWCAAC
ncbi:MAG: hypothetical protein EOO66_11395 [Methylobacterium sp.]|nr:hypothetical protein CRT23_12480 [Methylobacterium sp. V23]RZK91725.1 MAG: hypothetical protein EOO66_11395 [Methylobacterium sp.]